jgi:hypothetical protein
MCACSDIIDLFGWINIIEPIAILQTTILLKRFAAWTIFQSSYFRNHLLNASLFKVVDGWAASAAVCLAGGPGSILCPGQTYVLCGKGGLFSVTLHQGARSQALQLRL